MIGCRDNTALNWCIPLQRLGLVVHVIDQMIAGVTNAGHW